MSPLAWRLLALFLEHVQHIHSGDCRYGYIAAWNLGTSLGGDATTIQAVRVKIHPSNEYEAALKELIDRGLVEEMPELGERFRLVVKE